MLISKIFLCFVENLLPVRNMLVLECFASSEIFL